jgi:DNA adenine methylase
MQTLEETELTMTSPIVNVSAVRHLSPFRYPGGKTWLVPKVLSTLRSNEKKPSVFVDPFLGGGSVPLAAVVEGLVEKAILCEKDAAVAAVWQVIFSPDFKKLCEMILDFEIERERVLEVVLNVPKTTLARAFQTIVRNRTFRGGILASGASLVKVGENGRGVASRWYPLTLVKRIELLHEFTDKFTFIHGDGLDLLVKYAPDARAFIFVDPPYTAGGGKRAGSRLYEHSEMDHELIFSTLEKGKAAFMMTYDDDLDVLNMSRRNGFTLQYLQMKNTHHRPMNELLITRA